MSTTIVVDPERERAELERYLGAEFDLDRLHNYASQLDEEFATFSDEGTFYRESVGYLYDLTGFAMSGTKVPYLNELTELFEPGARLLDYGCGIGSDGLALLEAGYRVEFADFDNPSVAYLRWRLRERGLEAPIHDLDRGVPGGFDGAYAFDVIEHVDDPYAFLAAMEQRAGVVVVNLLEPDPGGDPAFHRELPIAAIRRRAAERGLLRYRVHYERSHLVAYGNRGGGGVRKRAAAIARRLRRRVRPAG